MDSRSIIFKDVISFGELSETLREELKKLSIDLDDENNEIQLSIYKKIKSATIEEIKKQIEDRQKLMDEINKKIEKVSTYLKTNYEVSEDIRKEITEIETLIAKVKVDSKLIDLELKDHEKASEISSDLLKEHKNAMSSITRRMKCIKETIALGISTDVYEEITKTLRNRKIKEKVLVRYGLDEVFTKTSRTKEEDKRIREALNEIIKEIATYKATHREATILDIIDKVSAPEEAEEEEEPRRIPMPRESYERLKGRSSEITDTDYDLQFVFAKRVSFDDVYETIMDQFGEDVMNDSDYMVILRNLSGTDSVRLEVYKKIAKAYTETEEEEEKGRERVKSRKRGKIDSEEEETEKEDIKKGIGKSSGRRKKSTGRKKTETEETEGIEEEFEEPSEEEKRSETEEKGSEADDKKPETEEKGSEADDKKPETEKKGSEADDKKPETEKKGSEADDKKPGTEEKGSEADDKKPGTEEKGSDSDDKKPGTEKKSSEAEEFKLPKMDDLKDDELLEIYKKDLAIYKEKFKTYKEEHEKLKKTEKDYIDGKVKVEDYKKQVDEMIEKDKKMKHLYDILINMYEELMARGKDTKYAKVSDETLRILLETYEKGETITKEDEKQIEKIKAEIARRKIRAGLEKPEEPFTTEFKETGELVTVKFENNGVGVTNYDNIKVPKGTSIHGPVMDPVPLNKSGKPKRITARVFDCWVDEKGNRVDFPMKVESNMTLKAKYKFDIKKAAMIGLGAGVGMLIGGMDAASPVPLASLIGLVGFGIVSHKVGTAQRKLLKETEAEALSVKATEEVSDKLKEKVKKANRDGYIHTLLKSTAVTCGFFSIAHFTTTANNATLQSQQALNAQNLAQSQAQTVTQSQSVLANAQQTYSTGPTLAHITAPAAQTTNQTTTMVLGGYEPTGYVYRTAQDALTGVNGLNPYKPAYLGEETFKAYFNGNWANVTKGQSVDSIVRSVGASNSSQVAIEVMDSAGGPLAWEPLKELVKVIK